MAHLITHHDPYHVHKTLGLFVLLHYLYRFYLICRTGAAFPSDEPTSRALAGVLLHGLLSWSSLLLPLPEKRNLSKPMIWPEFRLHSIVFATRHVLTTALSLANLWPDDDNVCLNCAARFAVVLGTVHAAGIVTERYGNRECRTTNAMPYERNVTVEQQASIKRLYTSAQFGSTITSLCNDPGMNFAPLLGIQMAPLLMTLVRKGRIGTGWYHRVYALSLSLGYVAIFLRLLDVEFEGVDTFRALALYSLPFTRMRRMGVSARTFWSVTILMATVVHPLFVREWATERTSLRWTKKLIWFGAFRTLAKQAITYAPLFEISKSYDARSGVFGRITRACEGVLFSQGLRGTLCSVGAFWLVQCCAVSSDALEQRTEGS